MGQQTGTCVGVWEAVPLGRVCRQLIRLWFVFFLPLTFSCSIGDMAAVE